MESKATAKRAAPKAVVAAPSKKENQKYPTSALLKSRHLAEYQLDFAMVILTGPEYTIEEAKTLLDEKLKGGN